jgi:hypothetical protein
MVGHGVPPGVLECLLRDVLRRARIAGDRHRDAEHDPLEALHERDRGVNVARAEPRKKYLVRKLVRGRSVPEGRKTGLVHGIPPVAGAAAKAAPPVVRLSPIRPAGRILHAY